MAWGTANKPKVSNKLGIPNPKEGGDGDIQVRQTGIGARLFAKLGGRWFSTKLFGNELDDPNTFIPKCWSSDFTLPSSTATTDLVKLPEYITQENILSGSVTIFSIATGAYWLISPLNYEGGDTYNGIFRIGSTGSSGNLFLSCAQLGTILQAGRGRLAIFFK